MDRLKQTQVCYPSPAHFRSASPKHHITPTSAIAQLNAAQPMLLHMRDGEVVLYRRANSPVWQSRYKLQDGSWHRASTRKMSVEHAVKAACTMYDEARFRQSLGLAQTAQNFTGLAQATLQELRSEMDAGRGKSVYASYITCIEKYFIPYFGDKRLEQLQHEDIVAFEIWRNRQMTKQPKASTLMNFASAWNRLQQTAIAKGWLSEHAAIPKLTTRGMKSTSRPAFGKDEVAKLLQFMQTWAEQGRLSVEREMRPLLRDYVEMLLLTGMRHGTEAMGICWKHIEWHTDKGVRYLRIWVDGKTGGRWLIAKHRAVDVLNRLRDRQKDVKHLSLDELLASPVQSKLFAFSNGHQPPSLNGTFRRLMRDSELLKDAKAQNRTLYSMRHTYATQELFAGTDIHTLAKQMGTSVLMLEKHYSKLTATMAANKLA
ncbi:tyrosine-type recombinase/integrase [Rhodoferax sp.]|uniref:tyrosine-type recombinase/integrase n=1 Tax=Rhodoferax sp. TaxID=50421 RepID=UPI0025D943B1|nr:tyrosine-type recombinase/integrase [Rhodoferax sp.]MCM2340109.1 tyrosine-type recombinase/integrase [Rhodoferax sp.]